MDQLSDASAEELILKVLQERGSMTSHELCVALEMEWTDFSVTLLGMIRDTFNPDGSVLCTRVAHRGQVYRLPDQQV